MRYSNYVIVFLLLMTSGLLQAQLLPLPGAELNYTQIMFEHPAIAGVTGYRLQVAAGGDFNQLYIDRTDVAPAIIENGFSMGVKYSWRYAAIVNGVTNQWQGPYQFSISSDTAFSSQYFRIQVVKSDSGKNAGGLICIDQANCVIDRAGNVVWFAHTPGKQFGAIRDFNVTRFGTISGLFYRPSKEIIYGSNAEPREYTLSLSPLWNAPLYCVVDGDTIAQYHHCAERLDNGHYWAMGTHLPYKPFPGADTVAFGNYRIAMSKVQPGAQTEDVVVELNKQGDVVWSWNGLKNFKLEELHPPQSATHLHDLQSYGPHMNAFLNDPAHKAVYIGFRDASQIMKVDYKTGNIIDRWGIKLPSGQPEKANDFFENQHDIKILRDGNLAVYNNGYRGTKDSTSSVVIFTPGTAKKPSEIVFKYDCRFDDDQMLNKSNSGGSVDELPNGNLLVCMGIIGRVFEVTRDKKVVWNVLVERRANENKSWKSVQLYRSHYTSSLYPCYFTLQPASGSVSKENNIVTVYIFNVGSEPDSYAVQVIDTKGKVLKELATRAVAAGASTIISVDYSTIKSSDKVIVKVSSETNGSLSKQVELLVAR